LGLSGAKGTDTLVIEVVDEVGAKHDINDYIQSLPDSAFKNNPGQRNAELIFESIGFC